jgi:hypothetical protein
MILPGLGIVRPGPGVSKGDEDGELNRFAVYGVEKL